MKSILVAVLLLTTTACGPNKAELAAAAEQAIAKHEAAKAAEAIKVAAEAAAAAEVEAAKAAEAAAKLAATTVKYRFDPPGNGVCAPYRGSFDANGQVGPEEYGNSILAFCSGQRNAMACRLTLNGETGAYTFIGAVGVKDGKTFVEAYRGSSIYRLLGCKANGRCAVYQLFNTESMRGSMCADPSML